jgi:hypothetical protein
MKEIINTFKRIWGYKENILILALTVVVCVQAFGDFIPQQTEAYVKPTATLTLEESIEARALQIFEEKKQDYMEASRIYALLEYQKTLEAMTMEIGYGR